MSYEFKKSRGAVDRFKNNQGRDIPIDHFLYACFEAEQLMKALDTDTSKIPQWPELQDIEEDNVPRDFVSQETDHLFEDLMSWYRVNFPELSMADSWDFSVLSKVTHPLVAMAADLNFVHRIKNGGDLPEYNPSSEGVDPMWLKLEKLVNSLFSKKSSLIRRYLEWSFGQESQEEPDENGSRPPVGRFAPGYRTKSPGKPRSSGGGPRGGGGDVARPNFRDGGRDRDRNNRNGHFDGGGRNQGRGDRDRGRGGPRERDPEADAEREMLAIRECEDAMKHLEQNADEESVTLKPQNSFYRRLQHQKIVDSGFHSESTGEGKERTVVVYRRPE